MGAGVRLVANFGMTAYIWSWTHFMLFLTLIAQQYQNVVLAHHSIGALPWAKTTVHYATE